jgi:hypothetical protein
MAVHCEGIDHEPAAGQVDVLADVADGVRAA